MSTSGTSGIFVDLNVTVLGAGTPVLALHGGLGFDHTSFRPSLDPIADDARLVYFDHRGNGRAIAPQSWSEVTHASYAADIEALRRALHADRIVLLGHSYGGFLALEYALRYPDSVAGLILCNTGPTYRHLDRVVANVRARTTPEIFDDIMQWLADPASSDSALASGIVPLLPLYLHEQHRALVDSVFGNTVFRAGAFLHALQTLAPAYDVSDSLSRIHSPALIVASDDDIIFPWDCGPQQLAAGLPQADVVRFARCGHYPFVEQREHFLDVVRQWLRQLTTPRAGF